MQFLTKLKGLLLAAGLMVALQTGAQAALVVDTGVTFNVLESGGSFLQPDVRGSALIQQTPSGDLAALTDFGAPATPNAALFGIDLGLTQALIVSFDVANFQFDNNDVLVVGLGVPQTTIANQALVELAGYATYRFTFSQSVDLGGVNLLTYNLTSITPVGAGVPEPGTFAGGAIALAVVAVVRRKRLASQV